jgi:DNA/RNA endonuclease YhcR with UshA esterase domain
VAPFDTPGASGEKGGAVRDSSNSGLRGWGRGGICFVLALFLPAALVSAQKNQTSTSSTPKYDVQTETKIKGTVEDMKMPPATSKKEAVHLVLKSGTDTIDVYLCPKSFLDDMGMDFGKGDELSITGSKVKQADADLVLAREVVKGNNTFVLRDAKGNPVWM